MNADPDPGGKMNEDPCGSGSTALLQVCTPHEWGMARVPTCVTILITEVWLECLPVLRCSWVRCQNVNSAPRHPEQSACWGPGAADAGTKHKQTIVRLSTSKDAAPDLHYFEGQSPWRIQMTNITNKKALLRIRNDLFRIRIQLWTFRVPDPDPNKSS